MSGGGLHCSSASSRGMSSSSIQEKRILCVGLVCLDVVHVVKSYPVEDSDQRSVDQYASRGGNASNSATVLAILGQNSEYFGTLAQDSFELQAIEQDFRDKGIAYSNCIRIPNCICPNSAIIVNQENASRTIIHTNLNLPELTLSDFQTLNLKEYSWIHFEGRNLINVKEMIRYTKIHFPGLTVSVEVEKIGRNYEEFVPLADVVLMSKDIAKANGASRKEDVAAVFRGRLGVGAKLICAWGELGGMALDADGSISDCPAFPPPEGVIDTIGAGDTFNGAMIASLNLGKSLDKALITACKVAGAKVGVRGFQGLQEVFKHAD
ncbi:ketohexokinase-like [Tigriopus californicus]|uniref:ketohexokinase-like n=1 Tax=Tigriopus californicus TaxID=6832 RepID=UPI0027DA667D|nr:ketohexokinase-like [Tigriopus californicus]|eukprot:TCALIF_10893-PA protein Name:"Similar to Khk Ketohexokinase (Mus musculus)" AED:0.03 eAED:0.03 QI:0/-1/0/1/-1/1/1/0/321